MELLLRIRPLDAKNKSDRSTNTHTNSTTISAKGNKKFESQLLLSITCFLPRKTNRSHTVSQVPLHENRRTNKTTLESYDAKLMQ